MGKALYKSRGKGSEKKKTFFFFFEKWEDRQAVVHLADL
jgi:quinol monooxygenase YgiN